MLALIMAFWFTISFITNILGPLIPDIIHNFNLSDLAIPGICHHVYPCRIAD